MDAVWKKLQATSKKPNNPNNNQMQNDPTGRPMFDQPYSGVVNTHFLTKPTVGKLRELMQARNQDTVTYVSSEMDCDFEGDCGWKWKNDMVGGFRIGNLSNVTGPQEDADGNRNGELKLFQFMHF